MKIGIIKEIHPDEQRVAITPNSAKKIINQQFEVFIETNSGLGSNYSNESYQEVGCQVMTDKGELLSQIDVLFKVNPPSIDEINSLKEGATIISFFQPHEQRDLMTQYIQKKMNVFSLEWIPRISRAQKMDALSSQTNLAGYKAVLLATEKLNKVLPMMMTAAGTIAPAKVIVLGVGVAGLQAIATAKRLGAIVEASDIRPQVKEQVESLGAKFIEIDSHEVMEDEKGYAKEATPEFLEKQRKIVNQKIAEADVVITTALVPGKKAPILITSDVVQTMKKGAVIVDMAAIQGGNCELTKPNSTYVHDGVTIMAPNNIVSLLSQDASDLLAKNISEFWLHIWDKEVNQFIKDDEIVSSSMIIEQGSIKQESVNQWYEQEVAHAS